MPSAPARAAEAAARDRFVLIVDDNRALAENLGEILEDEGYTVRLAATCAEARTVAERGFHVALVDLRLPDGEGTELAGELKRIDGDSEVILLTGFATLESAQAAVRAGAWAYLVKPCATPDLLMAVAQAVRHLDEKRELGRRAQAAERLAAVGSMAAGLSHEIKNPLNAAALQLNVLERRLRKLPDEAQPALLQPLAIVQDEIRRLNSILEEFLQYARPRELVPERVDLEALLARVLDLLQPQAEQARVSLERRLGRLPQVMGDGGRLQQAIMNILLNGIQATPAGGWVRVTTEGEAPRVRIVIEDSGPGIPEELRGRVFEPFFTTKPAGSGLGLPLVHTVVNQHGGSIAVGASEAGGARFVIALPVR